jgi:hypothetical protein
VESQLDKIDKKGKSTSTSMGLSFGNIASAALKAASVIGLGLGIKALAEDAYKFATSASDLVEAQNVVETTFKTSGKAIEAWTGTTAKSAGISKTASTQWVGFMGAMLKSSGVSESSSASMSKNLVQLTGDMSSFYNVGTSDMWEKIRSGISGETEPLKQIGINMSVANLAAYALAEGIKKPYASMTQAEQTQLRYNYLMKVTADAQGDFSKTLGSSFANQVRVAQLNLQDLGKTVGTVLLPYFMKAVSFINDNMPKIQKVITDVVNAIMPAISSIIPVIGGIVKILISDLSPAFKFISQIVKDFTSNFKATGEVSTSIALLLDKYIGKTAGDAFMLLFDAAQKAIQAVKDIFKFVTSNGELVKVSIIGIVTAIATWKAITLGMMIVQEAHNALLAIQAIMVGRNAVALVLETGMKGNATVAQLLLNAAMAAGLWPILAIIAGVALLAAGVYLIIKNWSIVGPFFEGLWGGIKSGFSAAINFMINGLNMFIKGFLSPWNLIIEGLDLIPGVHIPELKIAIPNIPRFDVGTRYLPEDMLVQAHKGEMIVPESENPYANSGGGTMSQNSGGNYTLNVYTLLDGKVIQQQTSQQQFKADINRGRALGATA